MKYFLSDIFYTEIKMKQLHSEAIRIKKALIYKNQENNALHNNILAQRITQYISPTHYKIYSPNALQILRSIVLKNCKTMSYSDN